MVAGYSKSELKAWEDYQRSFGKIVSEPVVEFGRYGDYWLVGHGEVTNSECDTFKKFMGCLNIEAHNSVRWIMPDLAKNSVFIKSVYHSCDNPLCPKCYKYGWATREAGRIEARLKESSKRFGLIEHIVVSVPDNDYGLFRFVG
jgi:hypothetical protein